MPMLGRFTSTTLSKIEPCVHGVIKEGLGFAEPTLLQTALNCVQEGGGTEDVKKRLSNVLEHRKASKLASRIVEAVDDYCISHDLPTSAECKKSRKRGGDDDNGNGGGPEAKMAKANPDGGASDVSAAPMTSDDIRRMMANTMAQIKKRKAELGALQGEEQTPVVGPMKPSAGSEAPPDFPPEKLPSIADLQASIKSRMEKVAAVLPPAAPTGLRINEEGRTVDASGQEIQLSHYTPTLTVNLRAKKRDEMKEHIKPSGASASGPAAGAGAGSGASSAESKFFDTRVLGKAAARPKRMAFKFNEPGKFEAEGNRLRMKSKLEQLQADISTIARKTGITSATQLAKLVPKDADRGRVPDVEWWDAHIMANAEYPAEDSTNFELREGAVTKLIEHPIQMMPLEPRNQVHVPVFLTKKERKKLRRQNRREAWKEKQDKIRLGLLPPDEAKVKMSNLMRVLGNEAVLDPTKVEATVREQMAKRLANHEKMNAERKLTPEQKKDKALRKIVEDTSCGINVAVYRVKSLSNPSKKFKVETNALQLHMTGTVVMYEDVNVIVVEGGPKQQKKYKQLMLKRIKWDDEVYKDKDGVEVDNSCVLVWEGETKERGFGEVKIKQCPTESFARDFFKKLGVEHYWDQAYSGAVLEATEAL